MHIITDEDLLDEVETFLNETKMKPTRFGIESMSDGALVAQLRARKRSLSLRNAEKVVRYMREFDRTEARTAE